MSDREKIRKISNVFYRKTELAKQKQMVQWGPVRIFSAQVPVVVENDLSNSLEMHARDHHIY